MPKNAMLLQKLLKRRRHDGVTTIIRDIYLGMFWYFVSVLELLDQSLKLLCCFAFLFEWKRVTVARKKKILPIET